MALKGTMEILEEKITYIAAVSSAPGYLWVLTTGVTDYSQDGNTCTIATTPTTALSNRALGVNKWLVQDIGFSYTQSYGANGMSNNSRTLRNDWRGAQVKGQPITLISKGTIQTNAVTAAAPLAGQLKVGDEAYLGQNGCFCDQTTASSLYSATGTAAQNKATLIPYKVGYFESLADSNGFWRIRIDV